MRLLLVEDDTLLADSLQHRLNAEGFAVDRADNGVDGEFMGGEVAYDIVILDLGLPEKPGLEVLRNWRQNDNHVPVIILTARDAWHERVEGFKAGADDYLGKPFHIEELLARIQALIRRRHAAPGQTLRAGGLSLDEELQTVTLETGERVSLTGTEFRLLRYFMLHPARPLSKQRLMAHIYEEDFDGDSNLIEVYVSRLREKLGRERITTRRGQGYVFAGDDR